MKKLLLLIISLSLFASSCTKEDTKTYDNSKIVGNKKFATYDFLFFFIHFCQIRHTNYITKILWRILSWKTRKITENVRF